MDLVDVYYFLLNNKWWLLAVAPFAGIFIVIRYLNR